MVGELLGFSANRTPAHGRQIIHDDLFGSSAAAKGPSNSFDAYPGQRTVAKVVPLVLR
ncbi:hypothetical protein IV500_03795 [Paeniglutamicibacter antarcticus]|uniref:Uncharacterized protein n=1 Tax=Arthrobacter terrae TaxID=2935737 RepID=A0A931CNB3_9MICC|nr:hypothetical protein [Arthrobacter terrae]MBG0738544.1 hypothetical protein [Arthrobacter terrae]